MKIDIPKRFYSLDILRGLAALSVVLYHWNFFSYTHTAGSTLAIYKQPWFDQLYLIYKFGDLAVQLFFCISGFVFFWLYSTRIAEKAVSFKVFSVLRISRLYPLHLATFIFVAAAQFYYHAMSGYFFAIPYNDAYHAILNLFLISSWGLEEGLSFNGPIWSVSVELMLYILFFFFCRLFYRNVFALIIAVIVGYLMTRLSLSFGSGVMYFFLGGIGFVAYNKIIRSNDRFNLTLWLPLLMLLACAILIAINEFNESGVFSESNELIKKIIAKNSILIFPLSIVSLALIETKKGSLGKKFALIGDISYSTYLIHFPMQLFLASIAVIFNLDKSLFFTHWFMVLFFTVLFLVSLISHKLFEIPIQNYLRRRLL